MRTEFQHILFVQQASISKTSVWSCFNIPDEEKLGVVKWNKDLQQYCYFPTAETTYSIECLWDIAEFIDLLDSGKAMLVGARKIFKP